MLSAMTICNAVRYANNGAYKNQRPLSNFKPSGAGRRIGVRGGPVMGGVRRVLTPGMSYTTIENRYVIGANVGGLSASVRGALRRRANNYRQPNGQWAPCTGFCPLYNVHRFR